MREGGPDDRALGATEGPPSARARSDLRADLRREVAEARTRFEEAGLRLEAHRLLGNDHAVDEVLAEQQQVLADLEGRLGRVVSAAVLQRDAEEVLAGVPALEARAPVPAEEPRDASPGRRPALAGVASAVAVLGIAALAVVGIAERPSELEVLGAADPAETVTEDEPTGAPSQRPLPSEPDRTEARSSSVVADELDDATEEPAGTPETEDSATPSPDGSDEPTDDPTSGFDLLVDGISDALRELGGSDTDISDPPDDDSGEDSSSVERTLEELEEEIEEGARRSGSISRFRDDEADEDPSVEPGRDGFVSD